MRTEVRLPGWVALAILQALVAGALLHDYIFGDRYFAFTDIGSDTFTQFVPTLMHLAHPANWTSAWSFDIGLGGTLPLWPNPFTLLGIAGGADHVLDMRIWVYLAKLFAGGAAFYGFILATGARREVALVVALAYSFCGFMTMDGQWDPFSTEFVAYALILWALARHATHRNAWLIPVAVAFSAYSGNFVFSVGVFILYAYAAAVVGAHRPMAACIHWLRAVLPQCALGMLLAAPVILPQAFQLLDSPRVTGAQSGFGARVAELLSTNDRITVFVELAGLFNKNLLGVGSYHHGWMNYLESPGFYVGMLPLLLIPQLWHGSRLDRRILVAAMLSLAAFIVLPAIRYLAFGFGLDYFRVNNLWVSMLLLVLFARALSVVAERGIHRWLLAGAAAVLALLLMLLEGGLRPFLSVPYAMAVLGFLGAGLALCLALGRAIAWPRFAMLALCLVCIEAIVIDYPSFHARREPVTRQTPGYSDDTQAALAFIRAQDKGFYRVEKTYHSVWLNDALAQGYRGVKSYWFQGASMVRFHTDLGLLPKTSPVKNFTNWLQNFGGRFPLYSLVGVKYVLSRVPLPWAGFHPIHESRGLTIYRNDLVLPLGVVYDSQFAHEPFLALSLQWKDIALMNTAVLDEPRAGGPPAFDVGRFSRPSADWLADNYVAPARRLQGRGMRVEQFDDAHIVGRVASDVPGILVFSIPFARGWTVAVDGVRQPLYRAQLGLLATDVSAGTHRIELRYALPGLIPGLLLALLGILAIRVLQRRAAGAG